MKKVQKHAECITFSSILAAMEANNVLLKAVDLSVKEKTQNIRKNIRLMKESVHRLEASFAPQTGNPGRHHRKAA